MPFESVRTFILLYPSCQVRNQAQRDKIRAKFRDLVWTEQSTMEAQEKALKLRTFIASGEAFETSFSYDGSGKLIDSPASGTESGQTSLYEFVRWALGCSVYGLSNYQAWTVAFRYLRRGVSSAWLLTHCTGLVCTVRRFDETLLPSHGRCGRYITTNNFLESWHS